MHRYRLPGEQDGDVLSVDKSADMLATTDPDEEILSKDNSGKTVIYEKHDNLLHGSKRGAGKTKVLSKDFLIKYIHVAKKIKVLCLCLTVMIKYPIEITQYPDYVRYVKKLG